LLTAIIWNHSFQENQREDFLVLKLVNSTLAVLSLTALVACSGPITPNQLQIDNDGGGRFSGLAGEDWTAEELRDQVATAVCGGVAPRDFRPAILDGKWLIRGNC
jgi:hypothetical protein